MRECIASDTGRIVCDVRLVHGQWEAIRAGKLQEATYQSFIRRKEHSDAGIDLADGQGNQHAGRDLVSLSVGDAATRVSIGVAELIVSLYRSAQGGRAVGSRLFLCAWKLDFLEIASSRLHLGRGVTSWSNVSCRSFLGELGH